MYLCTVLGIRSVAPDAALTAFEVESLRGISGRDSAGQDTAS